MPHLFELNDDVFESIMPLLSQNDASQVAMTCHAGYQLAMPRILHKVKFTLTADSASILRFRAFCAFMMDDVSRRSSLLRIMELQLDQYTPLPTRGDYRIGRHPFPNALASILEHALNLRELVLESGHSLLENHLLVCRAISRLPSLRSLRISVSHSQNPALTAIVSRPRKLVLEFPRQWVRSPDTYLEALLPVDLSAHVEELHLSLMTWSAVMHDARFPRVRHLTLSYTLSMATSFDFSNAFPALRSVHWYVYMASWPYNSPICTVKLQSALDQVEYTECISMPLMGRVRRLTITLRNHCEDTVAVLQQAAPIVLDWGFYDVDAFQKLPLVAPQLRFLRVRIEKFTNEVGPDEWNGWGGVSLTNQCHQLLHVTLESLGELPLVAISVLVHAKISELHHDSQIASRLLQEIASHGSGLLRIQITASPR